MCDCLWDHSLAQRKHRLDCAFCMIHVESFRRNGFSFYQPGLSYWQREVASKMLVHLPREFLARLHEDSEVVVLHQSLVVRVRRPESLALLEGLAELYISDVNGFNP